jgi:GDPmannose 4,6-dehydratase
MRSKGQNATSCILYNHESPRRPPTFVSRKISLGVANIAAGRSKVLELGNLNACRDWGWAPDYAEALYLASIAENPDTYIVATGHAHSIREFTALAFETVGIRDWENYVIVDESLIRTGDAPTLMGDSQKIKNALGWQPTKTFEEVVQAMVLHDLDEVTAGL